MPNVKVQSTKHKLHTSSNCRLTLQVFINRDLVKRRNRKRLGPRITRSQQMKLRHLVCQSSQLEQFMTDSWRLANFHTVVTKLFNCTKNRLDFIRKILPFGDCMLDLDRSALVFQEWIAQVRVGRNTCGDLSKHRARGRVETEINTKLFRQLRGDHPVRS